MFQLQGANYKKSLLKKISPKHFLGTSALFRLFPCHDYLAPVRSAVRMSAVARRLSRFCVFRMAERVSSGRVYLETAAPRRISEDSAASPRDITSYASSPISLFNNRM